MVNVNSSEDRYIGMLIDGQYRIVKPLGQGGMGTVYQAIQLSSQRPVALKLIHPHLIREEILKRFTQEGIAISRLKHPNIVTVYSFGQHSDGILYIAMELVEGPTVSHRINSRGCFGLLEALPLMIQLAEALAYAHESGIIHRDIKPGNMILTTVGRHQVVKLLDFGLAKIADNQVVKTNTGDAVGSPAYMSPEQWEQERSIDGRTDIYSLGIVFYLMLTNLNPFKAETAPTCMRRHLLGAPPQPPSALNVHLKTFPGLDKIIMKAMARHRDERYASAYELADDLVRIHRLVLQQDAGAQNDSKPLLLIEPQITEPAIDYSKQKDTNQSSAPATTILEGNVIDTAATGSIDAPSAGGAKSFRLLIGISTAALALGILVFLIWHLSNQNAPIQSDTAEAAAPTIESKFSTSVHGTSKPGARALYATDELLLVRHNAALPLRSHRRKSAENDPVTVSVEKHQKSSSSVVTTPLTPLPNEREEHINSGNW